MNYTLMSSNEPRGRLRGGVACGLGETVAGGRVLTGGGADGPIGGVGAMRARWIWPCPVDATPCETAADAGRTDVA